MTSDQRVSDADLTAALKRYGNNKAGEIYRLLLELQERREADKRKAGAEAWADRANWGD